MQGLELVMRTAEYERLFEKSKHDRLFPFKIQENSVKFFSLHQGMAFSKSSFWSCNCAELSSSNSYKASLGSPLSLFSHQRV